MLYAITHNKAGRIEVSGQKIPVRKIFRDREDMLTASLFSRVQYLSSDTLHTLFSLLLPEQEDLNFGAFRDIEFWPRFESNLQNTVEPDVILNFDWGNLVIEVKRPKDGVQSYEQWYRELECLPDEYVEGRVIFWALGGESKHNLVMLEQLKCLCSKEECIKFEPELYQSDWISFGKAVYQIVSENELSSPDRRVLNDILEALKLYRVEYRSVQLDELTKIRFAPFGNDWSALKGMKPVNPSQEVLPFINVQKITSASLSINGSIQVIKKLGANLTNPKE